MQSVLENAPGGYLYGSMGERNGVRSLLFQGYDVYLSRVGLRDERKNALQ